MNFFLWYYTTGLFGTLRIAGNAIRYVFHRFNIWGLMRTLFAPWKRDISFRMWRGFHPILFLQSVSNNILVSLLGAVVRASVIIWGLGLAVLASIAALAIVLLSIPAPLFLLGGAFFIGILFGPFLGGNIFLLSLGIVVIALYGWRDYVRRHTDYVDNLGEAPWRNRALLRLGIAPNAVEEKIWHSAEERKAFLAGEKIDEAVFTRAWRLEQSVYEKGEEKKRFWDWKELCRAPRIGKHWVYAYTPRLDRYIVDLSEKDYSDYRKHEAIGREQVMQMLVLTLSRPGENSALLVGNPGIGKRSIVHVLAKAIRENEYRHEAIDEMRVVLFDLGQVLSDGETEGIDPKSLLREVLNQAVYAGNIILVVENIDLYLAPGSDLAVGEVLHEYLNFPTCRMIGLMTEEAYRTVGQHQIPALKYFEMIRVPEATKEETLQILVDTFKPLERKRPVFTIQALESIIENAERYNWEHPFPERALDLAQEILVYWNKHPDLPFITHTVVEDFLEEKSGIPMGDATNEERDKLLNLETFLHERVVGQHEAIKQIAEAFRKVRAGLGNDKKPIGSFLFLGPTGVGKTETAKSLAEVYFGSEERMIRLDMSEFQTPQSIAELIGSAELNIQGRMTSLVREHPYSILLLDELDKAYPRALDLFLQILDEGFVTDGFGHRVNFRNTIVIATSNAGASFIHEAVSAGRAIEEVEDELIQKIIAEGMFRPEFLNRFDGVILFQSLTDEEMEQVTKLKLEAFAKRLYLEKKIKMNFAPEVARAVIQKGYKPEFGARSINRYIADVIEDATVKRLLQGELQEGAEITFTEADILE